MSIKWEGPGWNFNDLVLKAQVASVICSLGYGMPEGVTEEMVEEFCETRRFRQEMLKMWGVKK